MNQVHGSTATLVRSQKIKNAWVGELSSSEPQKWEIKKKKKASKRLVMLIYFLLLCSSQV